MAGGKSDKATEEDKECEKTEKVLYWVQTLLVFFAAFMYRRGKCTCCREKLTCDKRATLRVEQARLEMASDRNPARAPEAEMVEASGSVS